MTRRHLISLSCALVLFITVALVPSAAAQERGANGCFAPLALEVGQPVTIIGGVYIRAFPDLEGGIVSYTPERLGATLLGGPECVDGYNWWQVERDFGTIRFKGWVAQGIPGKQFILPNEPEDTEIPCPAPLNVPLNTAVEMYDGVRVRQAPSLTGRVLTVAQPETTALVLAGPVCNEGYNWWQVQVVVVNVRYEGWIVEGIPYTDRTDPNQTRYNDPLLVNPQPDAGPNSIACGPTVPLQGGAVGVLRFSGEPLKNLRAAPTTIGSVLYTLPSGITVEILDGPFCNEGVNWWRVRVRGGSVQPTGWLAEGDWLGRFLGPNNQDYDQPAP